MEFEGMPVTERIELTYIVTGVFESKKHKNRFYVSLAHPSGDLSARLYPDVDPTPFIGHAAVVGLRLAYPLAKPNEYGRTWLVDSMRSKG